MSRSHRIVRVFLATFLCGGLLLQGAEMLVADSLSDSLVEKYLQATQEQQSYLRDATMDVDIHAELPKLHKQGKMHALRVVSKVGRITYEKFHWIGDKTVEKEVVVRYLNLETNPPGGAPVAITPENYKFKYKGLMSRNGEEVYVLAVTPRKKREGLFKGELWLDSKTCMPVREAGKLVKSPLLVKNVEFAREYAMKDGVAVPTRFEGHIDTRVAGRADIEINYTNFARGEPAPDQSTQSAENR